MASNFNRDRENDSLAKPRSKINIEKNDLSERSGDDGFAMPDPSDEFWAPVIPGTQSFDEERSGEYYDGGAGKIASACARIHHQSSREQSEESPRFKPSKSLLSDEDYFAKDSIFDRGYDRETSFSQRRRNPSPAEDPDLLSFDEPSFKFDSTPVPPSSPWPTHIVEVKDRNSEPEKPDILGAAGACGFLSPDSTSDFDVLESSRKMLYEMFHQVPQRRIDRILDECNGSVTRCTDLLLEYPLCQEIQSKDNNYSVSRRNFVYPTDDNEFRSDLPLLGQKKRNRNFSGPSATSSEMTESVEHPEFGGILPNSMRHSQTNYALNGTTDLDGGNMYIPESCIPSKPTAGSSSESDNFGNLDDCDLFVPIDGEDWFDFQLTPDFVRDLFNAYSEPGRLTVAEMTPDSPELKIRIPPKLAFKLYQMLALSMMQRSMERERANSLSALLAQDGSDYSEETVEFGSKEHTPVDSDLEKFLREEMKLSLRELQSIRLRREQIQNEMATKLTLAKLKAAFPTMSEIVIDEAFDRSENRFEDAVRMLRSVYANKFDASKMEDDFPGSEEIIAETIKLELEVMCALSAKCGAEESDESELTAEDWRNKATKHHVLRNQYDQRGQTIARQGLAGALAYYTKMYNLHTDRMLEANAKAASIIMDEFKRRHGSQNVLDLHHLYVAEAIDALRNHLSECSETMKAKGITKMEIRVITGKGNNSTLGIPRISPAVVAYLRSHHYSFLELPGNIVVTLKAKERKFQY